MLKASTYRTCISFLILFSLFSLNGCAQKAKTKGPKYLSEMRTPTDFDVVKGAPFQEKYGQVESVKVIWDIQKDRLYFVSSHFYKWHYDFCRGELGYWQNRTVFNNRNYADVRGREYVLGNINHYLANDLWTLEFSAADDIPVALVIGVMKRISPHFYAGPQLKVFLHTQDLVQKFADLGEDSGFETVTADEIYGGQIYQALNCKTAFGYLRRIPADEIEKQRPGRQDIVVLDGPALEIPPVAGLLTPEFQTPLSHLNVLCKNRGTPFLAHKGLRENAYLNSLEGQLVFLEVRQDTFFVRPASRTEAQVAWDALRPDETIQLRRNLKTRSLLNMRQLNSRSVNLVGGKATNFSVLDRLARQAKGQWKVPEGAFAIPFAYYVEHLAASGADSLLSVLLADQDMQRDPERLNSQLKAIRRQIKTHPVAPDLLGDIAARVRRDSPTLRMRFRSSTNAEDIDGFNGAGLYTSKTGIVGDSSKSVADAIRKVWASAWNYRAFQERDYFGIAQEDIAMGILVHRSFPEESANGVAITKNLYRPGYWGFVINVQLGETSVVSPPPDVTCDQLICYAGSDIDFFEDKEIIEYISYSSLTEGKRVLTGEQVLLLSRQLARIKEFYYWSVPGTRRKGQKYKEFAMDVEFKFDGPEQTLYIKQARPYND